MKRILFLSYNHQGKVADAIQNSRLIEGLERYYDIDIVRRGEATNTNGRIKSISSINLSIIDRILYKIFPYLFPVFSLDRYIWMLKMYHNLKNQIKDYDYIILTFEPFSISKIIQKIKKRFSCSKIFVILYDPLSDNLFFSNTKIARRLQRNLEKEIIYNADKIFVNNRKILDALNQRYSTEQNKLKLIPLCGASQNMILEASKKVVNCHLFSNEYLIVHSGNIHGKRSLMLLNQSVSYLKNLIPQLSQKLRIIILGTCSKKELLSIKTSNNEDVIIFIKFITQEDTFSYIHRCNSLLLIDPLEPGNYSFPSKICEYVQFEKPIIGIASQDAPSAEFLKSIGYPIFNKGQSKELAYYIFDQFTHKDINRIDNQIDCFEIENIAYKYHSIFEEE